MIDQLDGAAQSSAGEADGARPLAGRVVLDFTTFLSGPFCTQILGDLGAEVIKIESLTGDSSRGIPPYFVDQDSAYYLGINRNKRSLAIDLKSEEGHRLIRELVRRSDVVVENFRPGVCARLGLDPAEIRRQQPELIWASISGFGQEGPLADRPAYDMIVQAMSGVMSLTGEPGRQSVRLGIPAGDLVAGMYAAIGVLAGLSDVDRSGVGRTIDVSMLDGMFSMLSYQGVYALFSGVSPRPQGSRHDSIPTYRSFTAKDGRELVVTANTDRMWRALCQVVDREQLVSDDRFLTAALRLQHQGELDTILETAFLERTAADWVDSLRDSDVPAALIETVPDALALAQDLGRDMVLHLRHEDGRKISVLGDPVKFVGSTPSEHTYPPGLGEHDAYVLSHYLGLSDADVDRLRQGGVLGPVLDGSQPPTVRAEAT